MANSLRHKADGTFTNAVELFGRIVEYSWFDEDVAPTPTEPFAWGYKFNKTTGAVTAYGWSGTAWVEVI